MKNNNWTLGMYADLLHQRADKKTYKEIGEKYNISPSRARQVTQTAERIFQGGASWRYGKCVKFRTD